MAEISDGSTDWLIPNEEYAEQVSKGNLGTVIYYGRPMCSCHRPVQWEYLRLTGEMTSLNAQGASGWELVSAFDYKGIIHFYFKRPKVVE